MKPNLQDVLQNIPTEKICAAILAREPEEPELADWQFEDAQKLTWLAAEKYLMRDLEEFTLESVEKEEVAEIGDCTFKYVMDLAGRVRGIKEPFIPFAGQRYCVDWKTSRSTLDSVWKQRLIDSWQYKDYHYTAGVDLILYRGLSLKGETKEVIISPPDSTRQEVKECVTALGQQLEVLQNYDVWPRNSPFACSAYGMTCEYKAECDSYTMPRSVPDRRHLSYSFIGTYMLCQEKARRYALKRSNEASEASNLGRATHRALAELWRSAYELQ